MAFLRRTHLSRYTSFYVLELSAERLILTRFFPSGLCLFEIINKDEFFYVTK